MIDDPVMVNAAIRPLLGHTVALDITPDNVTLGPASSSQAAAAAAAAAGKAAAAGNGGGAGAGAVSKVTTPRLVQLLDCTPSLAGAKASACARLEQVGTPLGCLLCEARALFRVLPRGHRGAGSPAHLPHVPAALYQLSRFQTDRALYCVGSVVPGCSHHLLFYLLCILPRPVPVRRFLWRAVVLRPSRPPRVSACPLDLWSSPWRSALRQSSSALRLCWRRVRRLGWLSWTALQRRCR